MKKLFKITGFVALALLVVLLLCSLVLQLPAVQTSVAKKATAVLAKKTGGRISVGKVAIRLPDEVGIRHIYLEDPEQDTVLLAGNLDVNIHLLALLKNKVLIEEVFLSDAVVHVAQDTTGHFNFQFLLDAFGSDSSAVKDTAGNNWIFSIGHVGLEQVHANIDLPDLKLTGRVGSLSVKARDLNLQQKLIDLAFIKLEQSAVSIRLPAADRQLPDTMVSPDKAPELIIPDIGWHVKVEEIEFSGNRLTFDDDGKQAIQTGMDYAHLALTGIDLRMKDLLYASPELKADIHSMSIQEQKGMDLQSLKGGIFIDANSIRLDGLQAKVNESNLSIAPGAAITFPSLQALSELSSTVGVDLTVDESRIATGDLLMFLPSLQSLESVDLRSVSTIQLNGAISGTIGNLTADHLHCALGKDASLKLAFHAVGLPELDQTHFDLDIQKIEVTPSLVSSLLKVELPAEVNRLGRTKLIGKYKGTIRDIRFKGNILTQAGNIVPDLHARFKDDYSSADYEGEVSLDRFQLGRVLGDTAIGDISLTAGIKGAGWTVETLQADLNARIREVTYNRYRYQNITIDGHFDRKNFTGKAAIDDPQVQLDFLGFINLNDTVPAFRFEADLDTLNLQVLNFTDQPLFFHADLIADFKASSLDDFIGKVSARDILISSNTVHSALDSLVVTANTEDEVRQINIESPVIAAQLQGDFDIASLPTLFGSYLASYLPENQILNEDNGISNQHFDLLITISKPLETARVFLPQISRWDTASIIANFDGQRKIFDLLLSVPEMTIDSIEFNAISIYSSGSPDSLNVTASIDSMDFRGKLNIPCATFSAHAFDEVAAFQLSIVDDSIQQLGIAANVTNGPDSMVRIILEDALIINDEKWMVHEDNYIDYRVGALHINQVELAEGAQRISIQSVPNAADEFKIAFDQFNLREVSDLAGLFLTLDGNINGHFTIVDAFTHPGFSADVNVNGIAFNENTVGDLSFQAAQLDRDVEVTAVLTDGENNLTLSGKIFPSLQELDLKVDMQRLNLSIADPFLSDFIDDSKGYFSSDITISGDVSAPSISGNIGLHDISTFAIYPNARYSIADNLIDINSSRITVSNLLAYDSENRTIKLTGDVGYDNFKDFQFDLNLNSKEFLFMNTEKKNDLVYGKILLGVNAQLMGTPESPVVEASVTTRPGTSVFVLPNLREEDLKQEDFVLFESPPFDAADGDTVPGAQLQYKPRVTGIDLSMDFNLTPEAKIQIIIDPLAGDQLTCLGTANLSVKIPAAGTPKVNGSYIVESGNYSFSYQGLLKKQFDIVKGSRIDFSGEIEDAQLDITTAYNARASTYELIAAESASLNAAEISAAKKRVPVEVIMNIRGDIAKPELHYDIRLPESTGNVTTSSAERKLIQLRQNQAELSKQVFALLLFNSFIADYGTGGTDWGTAGANIALQSVSSMLSNQFSKLSALNEGFEVNLDLTSYQESLSTGSGSENVTEMSFDISQKFLNDRLEVSVGGNVNFDNSVSGQSSDASNFTGDFVVEYQLTESGNYSVKVFRTGNFDMVNQSNIYRTGVGFTFHQRFGTIFPKERDGSGEEK